MVERHELPALPRPALVEPEDAFARELAALAVDSPTGRSEGFVTPSSTAAAATKPGPTPEGLRRGQAWPGHRDETA
ncbi:hypothetical protein [Microbispora sp. GKU 823]|uniref:hypothetical protein n=1 Tax=Microbispora sp. GKU 823 TaxID=1652100 RepID=UPI0009A4054F|nr:hypothetical protein [Microbispora sp. GKU 823]OPG14093.1 hypothetical protein B1L11_04850 [Microbispora sp. GKU 823]